MIRDGAEPALPEANLLSLKVESVSPEILERLALKPNEAVIHLVRQRLLDGKVFMLESIYLPQKYFPGLEHETELPHTLYHYYQESFKLTVHKTQDSIKAVLSNEDDVSLLCDTMGQALLEVRRVTETIDDKIIEFRVSRCLSDNYHYLVDSN